MFEALITLFLLLLLGFLIYFIFFQAIPKDSFKIIGGIFLIVVISIMFFEPTYPPAGDLWKFLSLPLTPLGLVIVLLANLLSQAKKLALKKPAPGFLWTMLIVLIIASNPFLANQLARLIEFEYVKIEQQKPQRTGEQKKPGAIVVLAQGTTEANIPYRTQLQLTATGDRLLYTAQLYREQISQNNLPRIIICASQRRGLEGAPEQLNEAQDISLFLQQKLGLPNNLITLETNGLNIRQNALEVQKILTQATLQNRPIFLVTSALQIRRAMLTFRKVGIDVIPSPAHFYTFQNQGTPRKRFIARDLVPSAPALQLTTEVIEEYLVTIYYFLRRWLLPIIIT